MPRKPVKTPPVEVVTDPQSGDEVTIYYDREVGNFWAIVPRLNERITSRDGTECAKLVCAALVRARSFNWRAVILIEHAGGPRSASRGVSGWGGGGRYKSTGAGLSFEFWRVEIAPKPGSKGKAFVQRKHLDDHHGDDAQRRAEGLDVHDHYPREEAGEAVIPYTVEAWEALGRLKAATEQTYAQLVALFGTPRLLATARPAPMMLAAAVVEDEVEPADDEAEGECATRQARRRGRA